MVLTTTTRLTVKNLVKDLYAGRGVTNHDKVDLAIERILGNLEQETPRVFTVNGESIVGCVIPVASMWSTPPERVERDGKKYLRVDDSYIAVFAAENYAKLVKQKTYELMPNGWGNEEDAIVEGTTYTNATIRDMDGIFDILY